MKVPTVNKENPDRSKRIKPLPVLLAVTLWCVCLVSALGVVNSTFKARQATWQLETLRQEASQLQVRSGQYLLEKSSWSAYARIEVIATEELGMTTPLAEDTILVVKK